VSCVALPVTLSHFLWKLWEDFSCEAEWSEKILQSSLAALEAGLSYASRCLVPCRALRKLQCLGTACLGREKQKEFRTTTKNVSCRFREDKVRTHFLLFYPEHGDIIVLRNT
jgi:hypothetical protein